MAKTLELVQSITGEGELHLGDECLGRVVYGFNSPAFSDSEFDLTESKDVRADIKIESDIDLWELLQQNAELTLHLNDGRQWPCRVGLIIDLLLAKRASLVGRTVH
jgi:hypothetical protein